LSGKSRSFSFINFINRKPPHIMLNLLITGKSGRMGQALLQAAAQEPAVRIAATHDLGEDLDAAMAQADCVIDFTVHSFTKNVVESALRHATSLVIGTTGHSNEERAMIRAAAERLPVVFASNYSVGVNTLFWLTRQAARILKQDRFDIEVTEMHHRHKIDSPSGTAWTWLEILNEETATCYETDVTHGRVGNIGPRKPREIGMHTLRGGDVVGDHTVMFAADGERVELTHKASSRLTFAAGAVRAAVWLRDKPAGLYDMQDVLGLKS
jgi:4-hydroxy-tetrahydrodipicolinate reductase